MTDQKPLVLFAELTDLDPDPARTLLAAAGIETEVLRVDDRGDVDPSQRRAFGVIAGYSTIGPALIDQLPQLAIISTSSNGTDMVDVGYATEHGIWVTNVGHAATEEVAVHALTLALSVLRGIPSMMRVSAEGGWTDDLDSMPRRLSALTIGIVGYGRIGAELARLATPLFGRVLAYDPLRPPSDDVARPAELDELLREADVVSLHLPLTETTRNLMDAERIATMRRGAVLVNTARGELVDENACAAALDAGTLTGVGLDVLVGEPPPADHPLRTHPRAIVTPHAAFLSDAALRHYEEDPARYILEWYRDGAPSACVVGRPETPRQPGVPSRD